MTPCISLVAASLAFGLSSDASQTKDLEDFFRSVRISPLAGDLALSQTGGDFYPTWHHDANKLAVTWAFPTTEGLGQVQCVITPAGEITFAYAGITPNQPLLAFPWAASLPR